MFWLLQAFARVLDPRMAGAHFASPGGGGYMIPSESGEGRFPCTFCNKTFTQAGNRRRHEQRRHGGVKQFQCSNCHVAYAWKGDLIAHCKNHGHLPLQIARQRVQY